MRTFAELLVEYTRRTGISDSELARALGVRRQTIFRWKEGLVDRPRNRQDVLACAEKLRLTPEERDELLLAAGFPPESRPSLPTNGPPTAVVGPQAAEYLLAQDGPQDGKGPETPPESMVPPAVDAQQAEVADRSIRRTRARLFAVVGALVLLLAAAIAVALASRGDGRDYPVAKPGEALVVVGTFPDESASPGSRPRPGFQERLAAAINREVQAGRVERFQVATWPEPLPDAAAAEATRQRSGAVLAVGGTVADGQAKVVIAAAPIGRSDDLPLESLASLPSVLSLTVAPGSTDETQALALSALGQVYLAQGDRDRARAALTQALSRPPKSPDSVGALYLHLGYTLLTSRPPDLVAAPETLDRSIELADTPTARLDRGIAYARLGDSARATADLEKAVALAPTDPTLQLALCWAYALDRRPDLAQPYCAAAGTPQATGRIQEARAVVDAEQGRISEAAVELRGFLKWLDAQPAALRSRYGSSRSEWLQALEAGRDPFDDATLDRLRRE